MSIDAERLTKRPTRSSRAGRHARGDARRRLRAVPALDWAIGALIAAAAAGIVAVTGLVVDSAPFVVGFLTGAAVACVGAAVLWMSVESSGARSRAIGGVAEEWTADALGGLGRDWTCIHDVPFNGDANVDHVLVGPAGVFAVETKFNGGRRATDHTTNPRRQLGDAISATVRRARKISLVLHDHGRPEVVPMLVVWGPGAPSLPSGHSWIDGVLVCRGRDAKRWRPMLDTMPPRLDEAARARCADAVARHVSVQERARSRT